MAKLAHWIIVKKAPLQSSKKMYLDKNNEVIPNLSVNGAKAVGVPGTIAGIFAVHEKFGKLSMQEIMEPVIALAKKGIVVTARQLKQIQNNQKDIIAVSGNQTLYAKPYKIGDTIKYPALANTLERILKNGKDEFYKGETAQKIVAFLQQKGGIISLEDLSKYEAVWRKPITFKYKDLKIISMSPPSSGGITLQQIMTMIEPYPLAKYGHNSEKYIQLLTEAERRSYADRNYFLGDPEFVWIPKNQMVNKNIPKTKNEKFQWEPSHQILRSFSWQHYDF